VRRELLEREARGLAADPPGDAQFYYAADPAVVNDCLDENEAKEVAPLEIAGQDLEALDAQARVAVLRRYDAAVERELLLLLLDGGLEPRERRLDLRVGFAIDLARGPQYRELALELRRRGAFRRERRLARLERAARLEQRVARPVAAEL